MPICYEIEKIQQKVEIALYKGQFQTSVQQVYDARKYVYIYQYAKSI